MSALAWESSRGDQEEENGRSAIPAIKQEKPASTLQRVEYHEDSIETLKSLGFAQLCLALGITVFHIVVTAMADSFYVQLSRLQVELAQPGLKFDRKFTDEAGTGVWTGLLAIFTACIGFAAFKKQTKGFICGHLLLNIFLTILFFITALTLSVNLHQLTYCRENGLTYGDVLEIFKENANSTQFAFTFYGEEMADFRYGHFYCRKRMFGIWIALDSILEIGVIVEFFVTLSLLIYGSKAVCFCCRATGCCGRCCIICCYLPEFHPNHPEPRYIADPEASVIPSVPMATLESVTGYIVPDESSKTTSTTPTKTFLAKSPLARTDSLITKFAGYPSTASGNS